MTPLRRLDDAVVPKAAELLVRALAAGRLVRGAVAGWPVRSAQRPARLLSVATAVALAGGGVALSQQADRPGQAPGQRRFVAGPVTLGPQAGRRVADYVAGSDRQLAELSTHSPDGEHLALVSFVDYQAPLEAVALLTGLEVKRVYLRAQDEGPQAPLVPVDVTDLPTDLARGYQRAAAGRAAAQQDYLTKARGVTGADRSLQTLYDGLAGSAGRAARAYRERCGCVLAAVVQATGRTLSGLTTQRGVRAVEAARVGTSLRDTQVLPLLPEARGIAPRPTVQASG